VMSLVTRSDYGPVIAVTSNMAYATHPRWRSESGTRARNRDDDLTAFGGWTGAPGFKTCLRAGGAGTAGGHLDTLPSWGIVSRVYTAINKERSWLGPRWVTLAGILTRPVHVFSLEQRMM
jgi:hypothetical protein